MKQLQYLAGIALLSGALCACGNEDTIPGLPEPTLPGAGDSLLCVHPFISGYQTPAPDTRTAPAEPYTTQGEPYTTQGDGWTLTVEEVETPHTRASEPLPVGATFSLIAYAKDAVITTADPLAMANYQVQSDGSYQCLSGDMYLLAGTYDFYVVMPAALASTLDKGRVTMQNGMDIAWSTQKTQQTISSSAVNTVSATLQRQSAQMIVNITGDGSSVTSLEVANYILHGIGQPAATAINSTAAGYYGTGGSYNVTGLFASADNNVTQTATFYLLPSEANNASTNPPGRNIHLDLKLNGKQVVTPYGSQVLTIVSQLEKGRIYRYNYTIKKLIVPAASNLYWDNLYGMVFHKDAYTLVTQGGKEIPKSRPNAETYQGLYFKFGSLVGMAPNTINPTTLYAPSGGNGTYSQTTLAALGWSSNADIPYGDDLATSTSLSTTTDGSYKGDVCRFLSNGTWRLPENSDLKLSSTTGRTLWTQSGTKVDWTQSPGSNGANSVKTSPDGTTPFLVDDTPVGVYYKLIESNKSDLTRFFPCGGFYKSETASDGNAIGLRLVGSEAYYWCAGTSPIATLAWSISVQIARSDATTIATSKNNTIRAWGLAVRCVLNN
ncbi:MAG: hypothetical protein LBM06_04790 [Prevotellaceae bacterium]|jgi:hypothetical protein|nr:hypothetical protein [Prevotellaceae bacterium]